jgi:sporulation protein YlmC with PRC-barrel domain
MLLPRNHQGGKQMTILSTSTLEGTDVKSPAGEGLGEIKDLMIDLSSGRVAYAVIEFGGLLGIGSKLFAVPMQALKQDAANKCFVMDTNKEALENASGFDKDHWPDFADRKWQTAVHAHYNTPPYWG